MRREVPLVLTAIVGLTMIISHFIPPLNMLKDLFEDWFFIIAAFAIYLGILNLIRINADKVYKKRSDWPFGVVVILGFLLITIPGLFFSGGRSFSDLGTPFYYLYDHVYYPLSATMFALLAFFVASASYRAFRARNVEATMLHTLQRLTRDDARVFEANQRRNLVRGPIRQALFDTLAERCGHHRLMCEKCETDQSAQNQESD